MPKEDTQFKPGQSGNPSGRPKNTLKDYMRKKFNTMKDKEKEAFIKKHRISGIDQWKMAEGNPHQSSDEKVEVTIPKPIYNGLSRHHRNKKDIQLNEKD